MDNGACSYRRFLDGDESAFDDIMNDYFDSLVFFVNRYVNDVHVAEDIAIDAFSELIVHKNRYNFKVSLKTYLFMIGKSRALNHIKRRKIINFVPLNEAENKADVETIENLILSNEKKRAIYAAIQKLNSEMQTVIHLIYFEDMSYKDASIVMNKTRKQIDNLLYRAKTELRSILGEEGTNLL